MEVLEKEKALKVITNKQKDSKKQKKELALTVLKSNIIFIIGVLLITIKSILLNSMIHLEIKGEMILYSFIVALLLMSPTINKRNKFAYIYLNIVYVITTIIVYANYLYFNYSSNFLSLYQIHNLQYGKEIGSGVQTLINIKNIAIFWIDNVAVLILSIIAYKKSKTLTYKNIKNETYKNTMSKTMLIVLFLVINICVINNKIDHIYEVMDFNKSMAVKQISIYYYHYEDAKEFIENLFVKEEFDNEKLKEAYQNNIENKTSQTDFTGIAKDKNVIIVQLESLNEYIIGKKVNGKEVTPNLNKFFAENIYCKDMFNQGLGTTADSEFEMENSMYPLENGYVFQKYYNNKWLDIYTTLKNEGYYTSFMHPNVSTYWNRSAVYNNGYNIDEYDDINAFPNIERAGEFYSDEGFFEEAVKIMNSYDKKFCTTLVSVSNHIAFELTGVSNLENKLTITDEDVKDYEVWIYRNYLKSCNFVDYAFGKFMEELEETGLLDKSILIVYGDHGAGIAESYQMQQFYEENNQEYNEFEDVTKNLHVPFGIRIPGVNENFEINRTVSKIDIKPTILDLLGIEDNFSLGETIFSNKDYSFVKGLGYITSKYYNLNGKIYDRNNHEEIEDNEETRKLFEKMQNEIYLSDAIIKNNLLRK